MRAGSSVIGLAVALYPSVAHAQATDDRALVERGVWAGAVDFITSGAPVYSGNADINGSFSIAGVPAGATVDAAYLYVAAAQLQQGSSCVPATVGVDAIPDASVTIDTPGSLPTPVGFTASNCNCSDGGGAASYDVWECRADVTSLVGTTPNGGYLVSGHKLLGTTYGGRFAHVSLVVIYRHASLPPRRVVLLDGIRYMFTSYSNGSLNPYAPVISGFDLQSSPSIELAYHAGGANPTATGDEIRVTGAPNGTISPRLYDAVNPSSNVFNTVSNQGTNGVNNDRFDLDRFSVASGPAQGDSTLTPSFSTGEKYWIFNLVVSAANAPPPDTDGDGYNAGVDCNDADATIYPGAPELCDLKDNDCDGLIDEFLPTKSYYADGDKDGYGGATSVVSCKQPTGYLATSTDCDDTNKAIHPTAVELCNGLDDNCDTIIDPPDSADAKSWYTDADKDSYGTVLLTKACVGPAGAAAFPGDCDDADAKIHPGATDTPYDGIDQNCDGTDPVDLDGDTFGSWTAGGTDCADAIYAIHPGVPELDNGIDDDCDGLVDEGTIHFDDDGDGFTEAGGDCDDKRVDTNPAALEICDGRDQDCDGTKDEGTSCYDDDKDGVTEAFGDCDDANNLVRPGAAEIVNNGIDDNCDGNIDGESYDPDGDGWITSGGDCDQNNADVHPGATELPNGKDDDCDGVIDEGTTAYDDDGDGFPEQFGDCDDGDEYVYTGADEDPTNGRDDDCDGLVDEGTDRTDDDGDGFSEEGGDCDDSDPGIGPQAVESEDGVDDDCDGEIDEGFVDLDGDGITEEAGDCDDNDGWTNPDRPEVCDGVDNNCDERIDEGCVPDDTSNPFETGDAPGSCGCGGGMGASWLGALTLLVSRRRRTSTPS